MTRVVEPQAADTVYADHQTRLRAAAVKKNEQELSLRRTGKPSASEPMVAEYKDICEMVAKGDEVRDPEESVDKREVRVRFGFPDNADHSQGSPRPTKIHRVSSK